MILALKSSYHLVELMSSWKQPRGQLQEITGRYRRTQKTALEIKGDD